MKTLRQIALFRFMVTLLNLFWQMRTYAVLVPTPEILKIECTGSEVDARGRLEKLPQCPFAASWLHFGTGLVALSSWSWLKRRGQAPATA